MVQISIKQITSLMKIAVMARSKVKQKSTLFTRILLLNPL